MALSLTTSYTRPLYDPYKRVDPFTLIDMVVLKSRIGKWYKCIFNTNVPPRVHFRWSPDRESGTGNLILFADIDKVENAESHIGESTPQSISKRIATLQELIIEHTSDKTDIPYSYRHGWAAIRPTCEIRLDLEMYVDTSSNNTLLARPLGGIKWNWSQLESMVE
jgi:hypothetical protein